ncbi:ankyrin repeat domain-containing protein [Thalassolituus oleivorans]|uniref:ankyrin repeat domain-containing protein n=1 Tax=Thalassolituus oleivorans TaxID=187493 RepID=UPI00042DBA6C|nr:ankyrin repeat domain-containing protein [Thalassolituus oleivorans]AHK15925.1 ankyrin [Thalassolituus oleivorans R6-15]
MTSMLNIIIFSVFYVASSAALAANKNDSEKLLGAIRLGDANKVEYILDNGSNPNQLLTDGSTPLAWAVESQNLSSVKILLKHGAKPNLQNPAATFTPLSLACQYGHNEIIELLLKAKANINAIDSEGISPFSLCAGTASSKIIKRMLKMKADIHLSDKKGQTPLMRAAAYNKMDTVKLLIKHGAHIDQVTNAGFTALFFAVKSGKPEAALTLLAANADASHIGPENTTLVQLAMYQSNYLIAQELIKRGADLTAFDRNGQQLLHAAVLANQPALVQLLINKGADLNTPTGESLVKWRYESNFKTAPYEPPFTPAILLAAQHGHSEIMKILASAGVDINVTSEHGNNITLAAAGSTSPQALATALALSPNANISNKYGQTPLHIVLETSSGDDLQQMLTLLAQYGANADIRNSKGVSAMDIATAKEYKGKATFAAVFQHSLEEAL